MDISRTAVVIVTLAVAAVLLIFVMNRSNPIAIVYGEPIVEEDLREGRDRAGAFVDIVQDALTSNLVAKFSIDTSELAVKQHAMQLGYDIDSAERIQYEQSMVAGIAQALEDVLDERRTAEGAFDHYALDEQMRMEDWQQLLKVNGNRESIETYRTFANQVVPDAKRNAIASFMHIYLSQAIEGEVCDMEPYRSEIESTVRRKLGDAVDTADPSVKSVWNYECRSVAKEFLSDELSANVEIIDESLAGFDESISFAKMQGLE